MAALVLQSKRVAQPCQQASFDDCPRRVARSARALSGARGFGAAGRFGQAEITFVTVPGHTARLRKKYGAALRGKSIIVPVPRMADKYVFAVPELVAVLRAMPLPLL